MNSTNKEYDPSGFRHPIESLPVLFDALLALSYGNRGPIDELDRLARERKASAAIVDVEHEYEAAVVDADDLVAHSNEVPDDKLLEQAAADAVWLSAEVDVDRRNLTDGPPKP